MYGLELVLQSCGSQASLLLTDIREQREVLYMANNKEARASLLLL